MSKMHRLQLEKWCKNTKQYCEKKPPLPFDISDVADAEIVDYNNNTKSVQIKACKNTKS